MKVLLEPGVWLADGDGDPPRTLVEADAKEFASRFVAFMALESARKYRPFERAEIQEDFI